jgi:phage tail-like protein
MRSQALSIAVSLKARYLKHLPGIYESDELVSRLLMLCESFWEPIEQQITQIHYYLDARMTPAALLPWLASWADWVMDERWPEAQQRQLVQALVSLYRRRGTPRGLREMLALYTGLDPASDAIQILEHRASNLVLGPAACLGPGVALGTRNVPHTFSVRLRLPRLRPGKSPAEAEREEARRRRIIEDIIEMEKPAHTRCALQIVLEDEA